MDEEIKQEVIKEIVKNLDEIITNYLFTTISGVTILLIVCLLIVCVIIITAKLNNITKNQGVIFSQLQEQATTQNEIYNIMINKQNIEEYNRFNKNNYK